MKKPKQLSWRTLMRKASKAKSPAEAKRLREIAAARRRVERAKPARKRTKTSDVDRLGNPYPVVPELLHTNSQDSFDEAMEELENSKLLQAELELKRRDTQLIAEFMSAVETIKPTQRHGQHLTVPWSQIEAVVAALIRLRWLETK